MSRLGVRILEDSGVSIRFIVLDSKIWGDMGDESDGLRVRARNARRTLARGVANATRRRMLGLLYEPIVGREITYNDLASALRAVGEHIPKNKANSSVKVQLLLDELTTINLRMDSVHVGNQELGAKLRRLEEISEKLARRNIVSKVDSWADETKIYVGDAIVAFYGDEITIGCAKLVAARNVLKEKLEHVRTHVLTKSEERALLISEIIRRRHERNERVREALVGRDVRHGIMGQLRESAHIKETMVKKLELALRIIDSNFSYELESDRKGEHPRPVGVGELAGWFKGSKVGELLLVRDLLLQAEQAIERGGNEGVKIRLARGHLSDYLEHVQRDGLMPVPQKSNIATKVLELAHLFAKSQETVLVNVRKGLAEMKEAVWAGKPKEALDLADGALFLLEESERLVDKREKI